MKILHSADWHLDAPIAGRSEELRRCLLALPGQIAALCRQEGCDLVLLAGDLFDGPYTQESLHALQKALEEMAVPVFISPGNHDFIGPNSPWLTEHWPENVHIFTQESITGVELPPLGCRVYGAAFTAMDCPGLLDGFRAGDDMPAIAVLHGDATQASSAYCPITAAQVQASGLAYLALGHIHKGDRFLSGQTLCAWPGCPMGRGYDEQGDKGVLIVTLDGTPSARFVPLDTPRFYDLACEAGSDPAAAIAALLPAAGSSDYYRIALTGPSEPVDLSILSAAFSQFPNLELRDQTTAPLDIWGSAGEDSFEGTYFGLLQQALEQAVGPEKDKILLAARISRQILEGQEVQLP